MENKELTKSVTTINVRDDLKEIAEKARKEGHFPAGVNSFSGVIEHLIAKEFNLLPREAAEVDPLLVAV